LGSQMYADDNNGYLEANTLGKTTRDTGDDDLSWLHPPCVSNPNSFLCLATRNTLRTNLETRWSRPLLLDLQDNAAGGRDGTNGHSYEVLSEFGNDIQNRLTQNLTLTYTLKTFTPLIGTKPGPVNLWLFFDSEDAGANVEWDKKDNHGDAGGNATYCDGHAAWLPNKRHNFEWNRTRDLNKFPNW